MPISSQLGCLASRHYTCARYPAIRSLPFPPPPPPSPAFLSFIRLSRSGPQPTTLSVKRTCEAVVQSSLPHWGGVTRIFLAVQFQRTGLFCSVPLRSVASSSNYCLLWEWGWHSTARPFAVAPYQVVPRGGKWRHSHLRLSAVSEPFLKHDE